MNFDPHDDYYLKKELDREEKMDRMRMTAGLLEFFGVIAGVFVIFLLIVLTVSLFNWLYRDLSGVFSAMFSIFKS